MPVDEHAAGSGSRTEQGPPPPAYFVSLAVENIKCFGPRQELRLTDADGKLHQWTVLIGENGVGKTTLLQCLAGQQPTLTDIRFPDGTKRDYTPTLFGSSNKVIGQIIGQHAQEDLSHTECVVAVSYKFGDHVSKDKAYTIYYDKFHRPHSTQPRTTQSTSGMTDDIRGLVCYGYGASRQMAQTSLAKNDVEFTSATLFDSTTELLNPEEWLLQADYAATRNDRRDAHRRQRLEDVISILTRILPNVDTVRIVDASSISLPMVEAHTPYGWVPIRNLSLGYQGMMTWMVDLASRLFDRYPKSKKPLSEPAIVLIDEIDLHLHPSWQRRLFEHLTAIFPNTQFVVTTHSPLVAQAVPGGNIVLLRREGDHVVLDYDFQRIHNWRVDQILTSDLFGLPSARPPQVDEALKERNAILGKSKLTAKDQQRLKELDDEIGELPGGQTLADAQAMEMIRKAAELIEASKGTTVDKD